MNDVLYKLSGWKIALLVLVAVAAPTVIHPIFLMKVLCFAIFACAVNLLAGYAGLLSLGHSMFFGLSAYIVAHTFKVWGWPIGVSLLSGVVASSLLGLVAGSIANRRQGIY